MYNNTSLNSPGLHSSVVFNKINISFEALDEKNKEKLMNQVIKRVFNSCW
jgi:hypothetical protein